MDRDGLLRAITRRLLESNGFTVLDADEPAAAQKLARLYVGPIHLVLIDTELAGPALAGRLRSLRPEPRVLYTSHRPRRELARRGLAARAHFIRKPFNGSSLISKIHAVLGHHAE